MRTTPKHLIILTLAVGLLFPAALSFAQASIAESAVYYFEGEPEVLYLNNLYDFYDSDGNEKRLRITGYIGTKGNLYEAFDEKTKEQLIVQNLDHAERDMAGTIYDLVMDARQEGKEKGIYNRIIVGKLHSAVSPDFEKRFLLIPKIKGVTFKDYFFSAADQDMPEPGLVYDLSVNGDFLLQKVQEAGDIVKAFYKIGYVCGGLKKENLILSGDMRRVYFYNFLDGLKPLKNEERLAVSFLETLNLIYPYDTNLFDWEAILDSEKPPMYLKFSRTGRVNDVINEKLRTVIQNVYFMNYLKDRSTKNISSDPVDQAEAAYDNFLQDIKNIQKILKMR